MCGNENNYPYQINIINQKKRLITISSLLLIMIVSEFSIEISIPFFLQLSEDKKIVKEKSLLLILYEQKYNQVNSFFPLHFFYLKNDKPFISPSQFICLSTEQGSVQLRFQKIKLMRQIYYFKRPKI